MMIFKKLVKLVMFKDFNSSKIDTIGRSSQRKKKFKRKRINKRQKKRNSKSQRKRLMKIK